MARAINTDNVINIMSTLNDANATEIRGLSIPEICDATGLSRYVVENVVRKSENGIRPAKGRSDTGAITYYHDIVEMSALMLEGSEVKPLQYSDEEKVTAVVRNLITALGVLDPQNYYTQRVAEEKAKAEKRPSGNARDAKNYWYWAFNPLPKEVTEFFTEAAKTHKHMQGKEIWRVAQDNLKTAGYDLNSSQGCIDAYDYTLKAAPNDYGYPALKMCIILTQLMARAMYLSVKEKENDQ